MFGTIIDCVRKAIALHTCMPFTSVVLALCNAGMVALDVLDSVDDHYIDSGHLTVDDEDEIITVPSINIQLKQQRNTFLLHHYQFFSYI